MLKWLNDIHFMSLLDLFQMFGHKLSGSRKSSEEKKSDEGAQSDKDLPTNLFTEHFTQVDNSYWEYLLSLLELPVYKTIRKITDRMSDLDEQDNGSRVDSFRIGTLLMPNKVAEEVIEKTAPGQQGQGGKGGGTKKETTTKKTDTRFDPDKDSRILYLTRLHEVITDSMTSGSTEAAAVGSVIDHLEKSGFLSTDSLKKKAEELFGKGKGLAKELTLDAYLAFIHSRLKWEERLPDGSMIKVDRYEEIKRRNPEETDEQLIPLFLSALAVRNVRQQRVLETEKKRFFPETKRNFNPLVIIYGAIAAMVIVAVLTQ